MFSVAILTVFLSKVSFGALQSTLCETVGDLDFFSLRESNGDIRITLRDIYDSNECDNFDAISLTDGFNLCFVGIKSLEQFCGASLQVSFPETRGGSPVFDWRTFESQWCGEEDSENPDLGNSQGATYWLCAETVQDWNPAEISFTDSSDDSSEDEVPYFQYTNCIFGNRQGSTWVRQSELTGNEDDFFTVFAEINGVDGETITCNNGLPMGDLGECVVSAYQQLIPGAEDHIQINEIDNEFFPGSIVFQASTTSSSDFNASPTSLTRVQMQFLCSNNFPGSIGYDRYLCRFEGTPDETNDFDTSLRVFHEFERSECTRNNQNNKLPSENDNCIGFLRSFNHIASDNAGNFKALIPGEEFNDDIQGPGITYLLADNQGNGDAFIEIEYLCRRDDDSSDDSSQD